MKEYNIDEIIQNLDFKSGELQKVNEKIFLTNHEITVLNSYQIPYKNCHNLKEILLEIEQVIQETDMADELDEISSTIAERDYYQNTNK